MRGIARIPGLKGLFSGGFPWYHGVMKAEIPPIPESPAQPGARMPGAVAAVAALALFGAVMLAGPAAAQENRDSIRGTNLEIPRFVTLKATRANLRAGPGKDYPIKWQYQRPGLPLKVIGEFEVWRKVEDHDGETGWMNVNMLTIRRMALISDTTAPILDDDNEAATIVAVAERGVILEIRSCRKLMCRVAGDKVHGWIRRDAIWGLLEGEALE